MLFCFEVFQIHANITSVNLEELDDEIINNYLSHLIELLNTYHQYTENLNEGRKIIEIRNIHSD